MRRPRDNLALARLEDGRARDHGTGGPAPFGVANKVSSIGTLASIFSV
jgi:hypothetical protein